MGAVSPLHAKNALFLLDDRALVRVVPIDGKGRGVVAELPIARGDVVERAHVVVVPEDQAAHLDGTVLEHYVYDWPEGRVAVALGNGSLFNHSFRPNARIIERVRAKVTLRSSRKNTCLSENGTGQRLAPNWVT